MARLTTLETGLRERLASAEGALEETRVAAAAQVQAKEAAAKLALEEQRKQLDTLRAEAQRAQVDDRSAQLARDQLATQVMSATCHRLSWIATLDCGLRTAGHSGGAAPS